jgi:DNA-binding NtrC family response regulator
MTILWQGPRPGAGVVARLAAAGFRIAATATEAPARVIATADAQRVPSPPAGAPWVWVCGTALPQAAAVEAVRRGAYEALSLAERDAAERLATRLGELGAAEAVHPDAPAMIAESAATRYVLRQVWQAARTAMPVLITGEPGTGHEEMAELLHRWSLRPGPYVPIDCAAIREERMESELFGHLRGAFSGAVATVDGKLLAARQGTVFLDQIDGAPPFIQAKLRGVLEDGAVARAGEAIARPVDFRVVAATNRDLRRLVAEGRFDDELHERLAIVHVELPPLRERAEDIPALARHLIARFYEREVGEVGAANDNRPGTFPDERPRVSAISDRALALLGSHPWPGNIRELRNVLYRALVYKRVGQELLLADLRPLLDPPAAARDPVRPVADPAAVIARIASGSFNLRREVEALERQALRVALGRAGGRPGAAARLLGEVGRGRSSDPGGTVRAMMRRLGVDGGGSHV